MKVTKKAGLSAKLESVIADVQKKQLRVGWGEDQKYDDGTSIAMIAAQNEFGNPGKKIPPRPFMRPAITAHKMTWTAKLAQGTKTVLNGTRSIGEVFESVGLLVAGDIRKSITLVTSPALKTETVKARLRGKKQGKSVSLTAAKPLIDSGLMLNSLTSEVVAK